MEHDICIRTIETDRRSKPLKSSKTETNHSATSFCPGFSTENTVRSPKQKILSSRSIFIGAGIIEQRTSVSSHDTVANDASKRYTGIKRPKVFMSECFAISTANIFPESILRIPIISIDFPILHTARPVK
jgi:hypothetical protein